MKRLPAVLLAAALAVPLTACSSEGDESTADPTPGLSATPTPTPTDAPVSTPPTEGPTEEPSEEPESDVLEIEVAGDEVSPNAAGVDLDRGEPLLLRITADRAGELHVHSRPEQYVEFGAGTTEHELVIDTPGSVEVEEHESGAVVAVIQVGG